MTDPLELDPDAAQRAIEHCYAQGWTDGLPVVPVSEPLLERFLGQTARDRHEVIGRMEHLGRECTVELAAINAAMAGCLPEHFPVVLAAWDALMHERSATGGAWQSTSGPAPLIVVNGPIRGELGFNGAGGVFGPGFRANATVARAIGLIVRNAFGIVPHVLEQATQGVPGRWSLCIAENEEESPWPSLAVEAGLPEGASAVSATMLRTCEFVDNRHTQDPEHILWDFADTIARTGSLIFRETSCGIVFGLEHAQMLAVAGYSKADVRAWLVERCGRRQSDLRRAGKDGVDGNVRHAGGPPAPGEDDVFVRILPAESHVFIVVAGARNAAMSMVVRTFGVWSGRPTSIETAAVLQGGGDG
ncbi:MAG TPA: hypothetical protein VOB72_10900 [Candidatus Dormibacteraeota bacterium]|nr:hypothetical protein [Candidatus Dormibacteraeota bacterium]